MRQVHNLARNSDKRDTRAAQILLEMAKAYIPNAKPAPDNQVSVGIVIMPTQLRAGAPLDVHAEIVENEKLKSGGPEWEHASTPSEPTAFLRSIPNVL